jgi:ketosteroid isomerase-like protein
MTTDIELVVRQLFDSFDNLDFGAIRGQITTDGQGVDEISRRWLRNSDEIAKYFAELGQMVSQVKSELSDLHVVTWGDSALVTLWLEQSYVLDGKEQHVSAPTTIALRLLDGGWKVALIHSVPLPAED